jgi:hypothetical protein
MSLVSHWCLKPQQKSEITRNLVLMSDFHQVISLEFYSGVHCKRCVTGRILRRQIAKAREQECEERRKREEKRRAAIKSENKATDAIHG